MDFGKKRLGNWIVTKYNKEGVPFIRIKPVSGEFAWEYSSLDEAYPKIEAAVDDESVHDGFQTCIGIMSSFIHVFDPVFYHLYVKCLEVYGDIAEKVNPVTAEEELEIIREMKVEYELGEELRKSADGEEGKTEGEV